MFRILYLYCLTFLPEHLLLDYHHCKTLYKKQEVFTHRNQSTAIISEMSSVGSPTEVNTITMVTSPAWGIPAAPILAAVAVMLFHRENRT